jgi:hypothetical protein
VSRDRSGSAAVCRPVVKASKKNLHFFKKNLHFFTNVVFNQQLLEIFPVEERRHQFLF